MVNLYFHTNDPSKRKAIRWLADHNISVKQRNLEKSPLTKAEVTKLLTLCLNGTDDLISKRSRETKSLKMDRDTVTINQLTSAIHENPHILKNPIIFNSHKLITGFDREKMGIFITPHQRRVELSALFAKLTNHPGNNFKMA